MIRRIVSRPTASDSQPERIRPPALPKAPTSSAIRRHAARARGEWHELADGHLSGRRAETVRDPQQVELGVREHLARW